MKKWPGVEFRELGNDGLQESEKEKSFLLDNQWRKNSNNTGFLRDLGEELSDRRSIGEKDESEVWIVESGRFSGQMSK
jgi:hypothetical protein